MAFAIFKGKDKEPHEVTCPLCRHRQAESPQAVSSYCKKCGAYLTFKDGEVSARASHQPPPPPESSPPASSIPEEVTPPPQPAISKAPLPRPPVPQPGAPEPVFEEQKPTQSEEIDPVAQAAVAGLALRIIEPKFQTKPSICETAAAVSRGLNEDKKKKGTASKVAQPLIPPVNAVSKDSPSSPSNSLEKASPALAEPMESVEPQKYRPPSSIDDEKSKEPSLFQKLTGKSHAKKSPEERLATCFECGDSHLANAMSNSTQCRKCGRMISLKNHEIKGAFSGHIQTRGDVFIHRKGLVTGPLIQCHNLTIEGDYSGSVEISGDLVMRKNGKVKGKVSCQRLLIERRAKVEFLDQVETSECQIDGLITGNIICRGKLALEKKATLTGDIQVKSLTVEDGAKHSGKIQMGGF